MFEKKLMLKDIETIKDKYSNCVYMTLTFRVKGLPKNIGFLDAIVEHRISDRFCFKVYSLDSCYWGDDKCKTIKKGIMFPIANEILCESEKVK